MDLYLIVWEGFHPLEGGPESEVPCFKSLGQVVVSPSLKHVINSGVTNTFMSL